MKVVERINSYLSDIQKPVLIVGFLILLIYMTNRAVGAIIFPYESTILTESQQTEGAELYLLKLPIVASYATNSILFPILLVVLYRLAKVSKLALIIVPIVLHYSSVVTVSAYYFYQAKIETKEFLLNIEEYRAEDGTTVRYAGQQSYLYTSEGLMVSFNNDEDKAYIEYQDSGSNFGSDGDSTLEKKHVKRVKPKLTVSEVFEHFYSPIMALLLVFLGALGLKYVYRIEYETLFSRPFRQGKAD